MTYDPDNKGVFKDWVQQEEDGETYYIFCLVFCIGMVGLALSLIYL